MEPKFKNSGINCPKRNPFFLDSSLGIISKDMFWGFCAKLGIHTIETLLIWFFGQKRASLNNFAITKKLFSTKFDCIFKDECVDCKTVKINRNNLSHNLFLKQEISRPEQKINWCVPQFENSNSLRHRAYITFIT